MSGEIAAPTLLRHSVLSRVTRKDESCQDFDAVMLPSVRYYYASIPLRLPPIACFWCCAILPQNCAFSVCELKSLNKAASAPPLHLTASSSPSQKFVLLTDGVAMKGRPVECVQNSRSYIVPVVCRKASMLRVTTFSSPCIYAFR